MADNIESSGKRVLLIRHGETEWNRTRRFQGRSGVPLNQKGKNQGHAVALALKDKPIKAIHSGPLILAMEARVSSRSFTHPLLEEISLLYQCGRRMLHTHG